MYIPFLVSTSDLVERPTVVFKYSRCLGGWLGDVLCCVSRDTLSSVVLYSSGIYDVVLNFVVSFCDCTMQC